MFPRWLGCCSDDTVQAIVNRRLVTLSRLSYICHRRSARLAPWEESLAMKVTATRQVARLMAGTTAAAIALSANAVFAQSADEGESSGNEIVVIGITKQAAALQDTPIAITAFDAEQLNDDGISDVADISNFTPGFNIRGGGNNPTALVLSMRGQVQNDTIASLEPSVGTYLDDVYIARSYGLNVNLVDMESVQVLKGPQGTLFGRNTSAGAVLLKTADPKHGEFSAKVSGTYGRFDQIEGSAVINVGLGEDFALRGAIFYGERGNYQRDVATDVGYGEREVLNGRIKASLNITPNLNLLLSADWFDSDIKGPARKNQLFYLPSIPADVAAQFRADAGTDVDIVGVTPFQPVFPQDPSGPYAGRETLFNEVSTETYIGRLSLDTTFGQVKFIGSYRNVEGLNLLDLDGSPFPGHYTGGIQDLDQFSLELQATGTIADGFIDFASGLTYFNESGFDVSRSATIQSTTTWTGFRGEIDNDSLGMYAQAAVHASDRLRVNAGVRYSRDDKAIVTQSAVYPLNGATPAVCLPTSFNIGIVLGGGTLTPEDCNRGRSDSWDNVSYTIGVDFDVTDDILIYAKQSTGYRSGAQQLRSLALTDTAPAEPEDVNEQEVGFKADFGRATLNVAAFHNKLSGAQRSVILVANGVAQTILENADTEAWGVEADASIELSEGLSLYASGSLLDVKYTKYDGFVTASGVLTPVDKKNSRFIGTVTEQFTVGASYERDIGSARLGANVSYAWQGKMPQDGSREAVFLGNGIPQALVDDYLAATESPPLGLLNARASVSFGPEENFEIAIWGKNILDDRVPLYTLYLGGLNYVGSYYNDPATYGVTASVKF